MKDAGVASAASGSTSTSHEVQFLTPPPATPKQYITGQNPRQRLKKVGKQ